MIQSPRARAVALGLRRATFLFLLPAAVACNDRPSDAREWRPADHGHTDNPSSGQVQVDPKDAGAPAVQGLEDVTIVAWGQNCTPCHGELGRGDGPRGPMLKATNLSDPAWQSSRTDQEIAASIKLGKGAMPAFNLPDVTIVNLVSLVRMMNVARVPAHANAATSAAPGASGTAGASARAGHSAAPKPSSVAPVQPSASPKPN